MRIGELAKRTGVNIQTIRFYERRRILPAPQRTPAGYRSYSDTDLMNLRFIKQSQELGFTLAEIRQLIELHRSLATGNTNWRKSPRAGEFGRFARTKLTQIDQKVKFLRGMRGQLLALIAQMETVEGCPGSTQRRVTKL